ncbi:hypothetical protein ACQEVB_32620 [Pseudonocardia sp. CA-107938]
MSAAFRMDDAARAVQAIHGGRRFRRFRGREVPTPDHAGSTVVPAARTAS